LFISIYFWAIFWYKTSYKFVNFSWFSCFYFIKNNCLLKRMMMKCITEFSFCIKRLFSYWFHCHFNILKLRHFSILKIIIVWMIFLDFPIIEIMVVRNWNIVMMMKFYLFRFSSLWNFYLLDSFWFNLKSNFWWVLLNLIAASFYS